MTKALLYELGQSVSFANLSLKAKVLWPMLLAASDDQGRGIAKADVIKWRVCPNVAEIAPDDIPGLLKEMAVQEMLVLYEDGRGRLLYQMMRWWDYQKMQWAQPSQYEAPEGWTDRVRANRRDHEYICEGWDTTGGFDAEESLSEDAPAKLGENPAGNTPGNAPGQTTKSNPTEPKQTKSEDSEGADAHPASFADWHKLVETQKNRQATLRRMFVALYPGREPPEYSYLGKVAREVGGAGRLAEWLWLCCTKPPTGNVLAYIQAAAKRDKARGKSKPEPAGFPGIRDFLEEQGVEVAT